MTERSFNVVLHLLSGDRRVEQNIVCSSIDGLLSELEARLGSRVITASFFNRLTGSYQQLIAGSFDQLPRSLELECDLEQPPSTRGQFGGSEHGKVTLKRRLFDRIRLLLLPLYQDEKITRDDVAAATQAIYGEFVADRRLDHATLNGPAHELPLRDTDILRHLVQEYVEEAGWKERPRGALSASRGRRTPTTAVPAQRRLVAERPPFGSGSARFPSPTASRKTKRPIVVGGIRSQSPTTVQQRTMSPERFRQLEAMRSGRRVPSPTSFQNHQSGRSFSARLAQPANPKHFRDPTSNDYYHRGPTPSPARSSPERSYSQMQNYADASSLASVSYTVAGVFPILPPGYESDGPDLRISLKAPQVASGDDDILLMGSVQCNEPVALCWWLAFGPDRQVLNLDKMYSNGLVATYQVAEQSFVLSFRGGSLVPGWQYHVHLTVTNVATGQMDGAAAKFVVPPVRTAPYASIGSAISPFDQHLLEMPPPKKTSGRWYTHGYAGDAEPGLLRAPQALPGGPILGQVDTTLLAPESPPPPLAANDKQPSPNSRKAATAAAEKRDATTSPQTAQKVAAAEADSQAGRFIVGDGQSPEQKSTARTLTYQEQLRSFFVNQIEPLYYLSSNPSMSEEMFRTLVRDVARAYWFKQTGDSTLTEETKRSIVKDVKNMVAKCRIAPNSS